MPRGIPVTQEKFDTIKTLLNTTRLSQTEIGKILDVDSGVVGRAKVSNTYNEYKESIRKTQKQTAVSHSAQLSANYQFNRINEHLAEQDKQLESIYKLLHDCALCLGRILKDLYGVNGNAEQDH